MSATTDVVTRNGYHAVAAPRGVSDSADPDVPQVVIAMPEAVEEEVLPPEVAANLDRVAAVDPIRIRDSFATREATAALARAEVLLTGWYCPPVTMATVDAAPRLRAIVHTAGTVRTFVDEQVIRTVTVCSQAQANAVPVAEYAFAAVVMASKQAFLLRERLRRERRGRDLRELPELGTFRTTIGVIGASRVGRLVLDRLRTLDARVLLYDPYLTTGEAKELGAELVDLETLMASSQVVSLHAPLLPATIGMITRELLAAMPDGSTFINTARGAIVDHSALVDECTSGRLRAVLDVTDPEPLPPDSPLFELDNVFLTPHISGSLGNEIARLGQAAVAEIARIARGEPLRSVVEPHLIGRLA